MPEHVVCDLVDLDEAVPVAASVGDVEVVVVRCGAELYCLENVCSHEHFPLSDGEVDPLTCEIECARHGAMFDLATGEPRSLPATHAVRTFPVSVRDGKVTVSTQDAP
jgi:3-phenylpropionate/trans-cinnamate dioxygenase ferredoxin component